jgi:hypothetical protein
VTVFLSVTLYLTIIDSLFLGAHPFVIFTLQANIAEPWFAVIVNTAIRRTFLAKVQRDAGHLITADDIF